MKTTYVKSEQNIGRANTGWEAVRIGGSLDERSKRDDSDAPDAITDTLANLMHLAEQIGVDFDEHLIIARGHYTTERQGIE